MSVERGFYGFSFVFPLMCDSEEARAFLPAWIFKNMSESTAAASREQSLDLYHGLHQPEQASHTHPAEVISALGGYRYPARS